MQRLTLGFMRRGWWRDNAWVGTATSKSSAGGATFDEQMRFIDLAPVSWDNGSLANWKR